MTTKKRLVEKTLAGLLALSTLCAVDAAVASVPAGEKCYGVVAAGKNDCGSGAGACATSVKTEKACYAWIFVPKGLCNKIADSSTDKPAAGCKLPNGAPAN